MNAVCALCYVIGGPRLATHRRPLLPDHYGCRDATTNPNPNPNLNPNP